MDEADFAAQLGAEGLTDAERVRACDALICPADDAQARQLLALLLLLRSHGAAHVATAALRALQRIHRPGDPGVGEVTEAALTDARPLVRGAALDALGEFLRRDPGLRGQLRERLLAALSDQPDSALRICAHLGSALQEPAGPLTPSEQAMLDALTARLASPPPPLVIETLTALGPRAAGAAPRLLEVVRRPDLDGALDALRALLTCAPGSTEAAAALSVVLARREREAIQGALEASMEALHRGPAPAVREALTPGALRPFLGQLWTPAVQAVACDLLGELGTADEVELLRPWLQSPVWSLRVAARDALGALARRGQLRLDRACELHKSKSVEERYLSLALLGELARTEPEARARLLDTALHDHDPVLRQTAPALLRPHATDAERSALAALLTPSTSAYARRRAIHALARLGPGVEQLGCLIASLHDPDGNVRTDACHALGALGALHRTPSFDPLTSAYPAMLRRLTDGYAAAAARTVLSRLAPSTPPDIDFPSLLMPSPDWPAAYARVFCAPQPSDPEHWQRVFQSRIRWSCTLLHHPPSDPAGATLCAAGKQVAALGAARIQKRNGAAPDSPSNPGKNQEIAWMLARYWERWQASQTQTTAP